MPLADCGHVGHRPECLCDVDLAQHPTSPTPPDLHHPLLRAVLAYSDFQPSQVECWDRVLELHDTLQAVSLKPSCRAAVEEAASHWSARYLDTGKDAHKRINARGRKAVLQALALGLSIERTADVFNASPVEVAAVLFPSDEAIVRGIRAGKNNHQIAQELGVSNDTVTYVRKALGPAPSQSEHREQIAVQMRAEGRTNKEISAATGIPVGSLARIIKRHGGVVKEKRVRRPDADHIQQLRRSGMKPREIAAATGLPRRTVYGLTQTKKATA